MRNLAPPGLAELQHVIRVFRPNVLIVGDISAAHRDEILHSIKRRGDCDLFHAQRRSTLTLPDDSKSIVVLDDVCELSHNDQQRLLEWRARHACQIVSFASSSPHAMVCDGRLSERLYYHLNTFFIVLGDE